MEKSMEQKMEHVQSVLDACKRNYINKDFYSRNGSSKEAFSAVAGFSSVTARETFNWIGGYCLAENITPEDAQEIVNIANNTIVEIEHNKIIVDPSAVKQPSTKQIK